METNNEEETIGKAESTSEAEPTSRVADEEYIYSEYIELGLGDLAFYGMLFSFALIRLGFYPAIAAFFGVVIGAISTIKLLEKVKMMPGLQNLVHFCVQPALMNYHSSLMFYKEECQSLARVHMPSSIMNSIKIRSMTI